MPRRLVLLVVAAPLLAPACKDEGSLADVLVVSEVEVTPGTATLVPGGTLPLNAEARSAGGVPVPGREVTWHSATPALVTVTAEGEVHAVAVGGPVEISATVEGVTGTAAITVNAVAVHHVEVKPSPASVPVGGTVQLTATAFDAGGAELKDRPFVWTSSAPATAAVTSTGIVIGETEGGPVTVTATAEGKSGAAGVTVTPRPATRLGFVVQPGQSTAGQPIAPPVQVAVQDALLGTVTTATNSVTLALGANAAGATLGGTRTVAAVNGIATFTDLTLDRSGTGFTLAASATGLSAATSSQFSVVAGTADFLAFSTAPPSTGRSGAPLSPAPVLQLRDADANPVLQGGVAVHASISSGLGILSGTTTVNTGPGGTATFSNLIINGLIGPFRLTFSAPGLTSVTSGTITLSAGSPSALRIRTQPSATAQSQTAFDRQPELQLQDDAGNDVAEPGKAITAGIGSGPGGATLGGTTVVTTDAHGTAAFGNLSLSGTAGSYTLRFSGTGLDAATSEPVALGAGAGTRLAMVVQPPGTVPNGAIFAPAPVVELRDGNGNPVAQSGVTVTVGIQTGPGTLNGTAAQATDGSGRASFPDLSIFGAAGDRTLLFASAGYVSAASAPVTVTAGPPVLVFIRVQPSATAASGQVLAQQPLIELHDAAGNPVKTAGTQVSVSLKSGPLLGFLSGTRTVTTDDTGTAAFTDLKLTGNGNYTLEFTSGNLTSAVSITISVS